MSDYAKIAGLIAEDFYKGRFDLSARKKVSSASSWSSMPHVECVNFLRESGASERTILLFITFIAAIDRGRDSEQLWWSGLELFDSHPEVFDPLALFNVSVEELSALMNESDVSHKNEQVPQAWLDIARTIALESHCPVSRVIYGNTVDAKKPVKRSRYARRRWHKPVSASERTENRFSLDTNALMSWRCKNCTPGSFADRG